MLKTLLSSYAGKGQKLYLKNYIFNIIMISFSNLVLITKIFHLAKSQFESL
jgi:hypothetical protein